MEHRVVWVEFFTRKSGATEAPEIGRTIDRVVHEGWQFLALSAGDRGAFLTFRREGPPLR